MIQAQSYQNTNKSQSIIEDNKQEKQIQVQPPQGYSFIKTIGDGSFGKVKLGMHKLTQQNVAIKILCKDKIRESTDVVRITRQIKIMKAVRHPFIIQTYQIIQSQKHLFLIMEYVEGGDLFDLITKKGKLTEMQACSIFSQIVLGLQYLHKQGISHRDMKPQNILITDKNKIKIADFGLGNFFTKGQTLKTACGSPCYAPPQMLNQEDYDPQKVDIWSSGIILYAMVHGYLPFQHEITTKLYQRIKTKNVVIQKSIGTLCRNLIQGLLMKSYAQRLSIQIIKKHEFLLKQIQKQEQYVILQTSQLTREKVKQICQVLGLTQQQRLYSSLMKNKHNNLTTVYYLGRKLILKAKQQEQQKQPVQQLKMSKQLFSFSQPKKEEVTQIYIQKKQIESVKQLQLQSKKVIKSNQISQLKQIEQLQESPKPIQKVPLKSSQILKGQQSQISNRNKSRSITQNQQINRLAKPKKIIEQIQKQTIQKKPFLKKSERMNIRKPKQQSSKIIGDIRLNQRSHSKDRPLVLKNSLKIGKQKITEILKQQKQIVFKPIYIQPTLVDAQRIVLNQIQMFCNLLYKKGYTGKIQYFSYSKDCFLIIKSLLKPQKNSKQPIQALQKIIAQNNTIKN